VTDYDRYKLQAPEDEADERERRLRASPDPDDLADELYLRWKEGDLDRVRRRD